MLLPILRKSFLFGAFMVGIWDYTYIWLDQMWFLLYIWKWEVCKTFSCEQQWRYCLLTPQFIELIYASLYSIFIQVFIHFFFPSFIHFFQSFDCSLVGSFVPLFSLLLCSFIRVHTSISTYWISYVLQIRYKIVSNVISITAWTVFSDECSKFFLLKLRWPMDPQTINAMYSFNENEISKYHKVWFISPSFILLFISAWLLFVDFTYFCMISKL